MLLVKSTVNNSAHIHGVVYHIMNMTIDRLSVIGGLDYWNGL